MGNLTAILTVSSTEMLPFNCDIIWMLSAVAYNIEMHTSQSWNVDTRHGWVSTL